jgi:3',5'-cyclic-AMP phosphodiesterase
MNRRSFIQQCAAASAVLFIPGQTLAGDATFPKKKVRFRFAIASDGHYGQPDTPYRENFNTLMSWLNNERKNRLDFALFNGDLIHDNPDLLPEIKPYFERLQCPYYVNRGNHDRASHQLWEETCGYPTNHDFTMGEYAFILADTSNEKGDFLCPDADWLSSRLQHYADKKYTFVFLHITPDKWTEYGVDCPQVRESFARFPNVAAIFHGHDHDQDDVKMAGGKHYFFDGRFGGNWGVDYIGYRIVEINSDGTLFTYQVNPALKSPVNSNTIKIIG